MLLTILSPAVALTAISGNANAFLIPLLAFAAASRRPHVIGVSVVMAAAVKVAPILLIPWAISMGAARSIIATSGLVLLLTLVAAGPASIVDWLRGIEAASPSPLSVAHLLGVAPGLVSVGALGAMIVVWLVARRRPRVLFAYGLIFTVLATPALYFEALALVAAAAGVLGSSPARSASAATAIPPG